MSHKRNDGNVSDKDEARTPPGLFKKLDERFHFELDAFCTPQNKLCRFGFTKEQDALQQDWANAADVIFGNPPYSNPAPFVKKASEESHKGITTVMLLPVDTSTRWFHEYIMGVDFDQSGIPIPNGYGASEIIYLIPRVKYLNPDGTPMKGSPLTAAQVVVFKEDEFDGSPVISSMRWK